MSKKNFLFAVILTCATSPAYAVFFTVSFEEFRGELPKVPYEATTFDQDDLVKEAARMRGDGIEAEPLAACDALIADETLPFELRRWAVRQKMTLCSYTGRCEETMDTGRAWLREHEAADPDALYIRRVMAHVIVRRCRPDFVLQYEGAREVFEEMFANHPPDNIYVISARYNYAMALEILAERDEDLRYTAALQLYTASNAMTAYMEKEELSPHRRERCEMFIQLCGTEIHRLLSDKWTPRPRPRQRGEEEEPAPSTPPGRGRGPQ